MGAPQPADHASPPSDPATFAAFAGALVRRYGPRGSFWSERPDVRRLPVRAWQVWNEPNLTSYWSVQPFAPGYVRLLRAARQRDPAADPRAQVVLAGLPNRSWEALRAIYRAGGRGAFDAVALHPFTGLPRFVMKIIRLGRREMRRAGDGAPADLAHGAVLAGLRRVACPRRGGFEVTDAGQAARLARGAGPTARAAPALGIGRVFWYTWLSTEMGPTAFDWSGLRRVRDGTIVSAPALAVFSRWARRLQGCVKVPGDASRCR